MNRTPADQIARDVAIHDVSTPLFVEAGAGTGKTSLLAARYVYLVEKRGIRPSQIVAITFTEKAAGELRNRIRSSLEAKQLNDAMAQLDQAPISTIHSFAASLLRERPFEAQVDPQFEQLDEFGLEFLLRAVYQQWLPKNLQPPLLRALGVGIDFSKIRSVAFSLYRYRDLRHLLPKTTSPFDASVFYKHFYQEVESLWGKAQSECVDTKDAGYVLIRDLFAHLDMMKDAPSAAQERFLLTQIEILDKGNQKKWAKPAVLADQKKVLSRLKVELVEIQTLLRQEIFTDLLGCLEGFVDQVQEEKRTRGVVDFDDLLYLSRDLVLKHPNLSAEWSNRFAYFLVDECQDIDPVQAELIWRLCSSQVSQTPWFEWTLIPGKLFLVGDPKQSIYRFRRASIEAFEAAKTQMSAQGKCLQVSQNFRSSAALIDWINAVFGPILMRLYHPLTPDPEHQSSYKGPALVCLEAPQSENDVSKARDVRKQEAQAIAAFVREQLDRRNFLPGEIAILFPTTTDIDLFEETFRHFELPFSLEGGHLFFGRSEIHGVTETLEAIARPYDSIAVIAALRSVLFGASDQDLVDLLKQGSRFDYREHLPGNIRLPVIRAFEILRNLHAKRFDVSPSRLIEELYFETSAIPLALFRYHGLQAAANLEKLLVLARNLEQQNQMNFSDFVSWLSTQSDEQGQQSEAPLSEGDASRIRLMTIHKSKGLEFSMVVLANLSALSNRDDPVVADRLRNSFALGTGPKKARFSTANYESMMDAERLEHDAERRRLLYVAATRAKDLLVIPKFLPSEKKSLLWNILDEGWEQGLSHIKNVAFESLPVREKKEDAASVDAGQLLESFPALEQKLQNIQEAIEQRPTRYIRPQIIAPASLVIHAPSVAGSPSTTTAPALTFGTAFHRVMERIDLSGKPDIADACKRVLPGSDDLSLLEDLERLVQSALVSDLFTRIRKASWMGREIPFSWSSESILYEGNIDLVFEETGGLVIVDYKTDRLDPSEISIRGELYRPQMDIYRKAISQITKKPVKDVILYFARPAQAIRLEF